MSTDCQYSPVSSQDSDLASADKQSYPSSDVYSPENDSTKLQQLLGDDPKLHEEKRYQEFVNTIRRNTLRIPGWPGPQTLEKTLKEKILLSFGYMLCLVPPLFFLGKNTRYALNI
jgi:hypothetical protein